MTETSATRGETLLCGDARAVLAGLPEQSVHCCITSPPYFGLRSYNGGAAEIGAEQTPQEYVAALVDVFRALWPVLRDEGTLWLVLGDSYAAGGIGAAPSRKSTLQRHGADGRSPLLDALGPGRTRRPPVGVRAKSLLGIPWRVAFALQDDGWLLRQELIWHKSNPMPESVKDRCTRGHETVFMLAKGPRYYYDQDAIREPHATGEHQQRYPDTRYTHAPVVPLGDGRTRPRHGGFDRPASGINPAGRNKRSVWTVATAPVSSKKYGVATEHYAAFPPELVRPMVRAGCPPEGMVLDCFCGSGTTGLMAVQEGRRFVGIDLNAAYVGLARARIATGQPALFSGAATAV